LTTKTTKSNQEYKNLIVELKNKKPLEEFKMPKEVK